MSANPTQRKSDLLSEHVRHEIDDWLARYPEDQRQSAVLGALRAVQHEQGHLSTQMMDAVADYIGMSEIAVYEVGSFYSMFELEPVGKHSISVCTNISCMLRGGDKILEHLEQKLGVGLGESTPDGRFFLKREEECLAGCCGAPMMQVDHVYHEHLTPEKVDEILDKLD
ncbi:MULTISPECIES: NAD(P)H-dependent oxidoreductase subunit E [unclassified Ectothiorhodospira]|uniref:NADH-quinone oxidoreductase subunit NuoE family protein n=1 Tax=unclassified Ectothiorhodospira TaxID=2684909 RepID=UPI001EE9A999|nr:MULTISPECIES: NAD(P)H-dependent oxidoreductase subunit E [unclassified Ectothiorhodospira]MCG5514876.1 NAD(P)H-dependent oxidoreductase subunit E [Ectothiorhodospira sp. 9100]MCG5517570.1 NAD(P)H-dependent oxidoreductase subunit E [Ectothiorhodospira sp. 9905]